jgi:hypothetical protein
MADKELSCGVCSADLLLAGDESKGDEVFCAYCHSPHRLTAAATDEECEVEEDF